MIKILDSGILYRNPLPQLRPVHAIHPNLLQLSDQEFLCVYRRGVAFECTQGNIGQLRSTDGGKSWIDEGLVYDRSRDDRPYSYRGGQLTKLSNGSLFLLTSRWDRSDPDKPLYNPETEGYLPVEMLYFRSEDNGHNWSGPHLVTRAGEIIGNNSGPVLELSDGRLLLPFETWKAYDDPAPAKQRAMALFSEDGGKTWGNPTVVADGTAEQIIYWDMRIIPLGGDRLFSVFWTHDMKTDKDLQIHRSISEDGGKTWSKPVPTGIEGQVSQPVHLGAGRILLLYNLRYAERPGIMAVLSEDEGRTWDLAHQITVWDAAGQTNVGTATRDRAVADMSTFAFGYPGGILTNDGTVLMSYWATQSCVTHIRWARLQVG